MGPNPSEGLVDEPGKAHPWKGGKPSDLVLLRDPRKGLLNDAWKTPPSEGVAGKPQNLRKGLLKDGCKVSFWYHFEPFQVHLVPFGSLRLFFRKNLPLETAFHAEWLRKEGPIPFGRVFFGEAWMSQNPRKSFLKDVWKAPRPRKGCLKKLGKAKGIGRGC